MKKITLLILVFFSVIGFSQNSPAKDRGSLCRYFIVNSDTIPVVDLPVCVISVSKTPYRTLTRNEQKRYNRLHRYVKKVYPYATLAGNKLKECEIELIGVEDEGDRRKIMKKVEIALKERYGDELKNLTVTQGKILLKLIDRQTGHTSYELLKELRGSFSAAMWQGLAVLFGHSLKLDYEPRGDDWMIEDIITKIENGTY